MIRRVGSGAVAAALVLSAPWLGWWTLGLMALSEIRHTATAVGCHHRQITEHPARIMRRTTLAGARKSTSQTIRQTEPLRHQHQQARPRTRRQLRPVRCHIYRSKRRISHHLQGEPPERVDCCLRKRNPARPGGRFRPPTPSQSALQPTNAG
jgi:hypothetical protein